MRAFSNKYYPLGKTILFVFMIFFCKGCALTAPSTERLIFQDKNQTSNFQSIFPESNTSVKKQQLLPSFLLYHLNTTFRPILDAELQYAKRKFTSYIKTELENNPHLNSDDLLIRNPYYFSISAPLTLVERPTFSWALSAGYLVLNTDVTVNMGNNFYGTATVGVGDGEIILQKKVLDSNAMRLALGGYYRAERRGFEIEGNQTGPSMIFGPIIDGLSADRIFYTHTIGPRFNSLIPLNEKSFLHIRIAPGYSITLQEPVINVGVTMQLVTK